MHAAQHVKRRLSYLAPLANEHANAAACQQQGIMETCNPANGVIMRTSSIKYWVWGAVQRHTQPSSIDLRCKA